MHNYSCSYILNNECPSLWYKKVTGTATRVCLCMSVHVMPVFACVIKGIPDNICPPAAQARHKGICEGFQKVKRGQKENLVSR